MKVLELSQAAVGQRLGISQPAISQLLGGDTRPSQQTILLLEVLEGEVAARERNGQPKT